MIAVITSTEAGAAGGQISSSLSFQLPPFTMRFDPLAGPVGLRMGEVA